MSIISAIKNAFARTPIVHPVERSLATRWIKQRLLSVFPELRGNPKALEAAYRSLGLDAKDEGEQGIVFEITAHRDPGQ